MSIEVNMKTGTVSPLTVTGRYPLPNNLGRYPQNQMGAMIAVAFYVGITAPWEPKNHKEQHIKERVKNPTNSFDCQFISFYHALEQVEGQIEMGLFKLSLTGVRVSVKERTGRKAWSAEMGEEKSSTAIKKILESRLRNNANSIDMSNIFYELLNSLREETAGDLFTGKEDLSAIVRGRSILSLGILSCLKEMQITDVYSGFGRTMFDCVMMGENPLAGGE
ncbi:hypothetical protein A2230_08690 [candidate division WOR-1 bacterium RIFOXYA2_FULL_36_21]|uniref:Uncharacterized protein n=1 Tax=candidate division WOR-1 bacterium RIFOXYB2_FULL_36_35 TaxID=1802578 RepID=A0A1F4RYM8_UNCSA|nr:MAG: hypothetical protein A2230_08690 [candidate division WOR-1 bacterium RIFOXYA2_FULL_36_21]OGC13288.1 MAG: hypothetical protein A2290_08135 [candidate division WOR-1 bacterium RIFOXYB2_FULL_36_35]OGC16609.1 MAG: hypothetical protein A2282_02545 [candidate division WOR-1 bacterium RIFOXYA12_FULL_36_13]